jgi:hypothetical protein
MKEIKNLESMVLLGPTTQSTVVASLAAFGKLQIHCTYLACVQASF